MSKLFEDGDAEPSVDAYWVYYNDTRRFKP